MKLFLKKLLNSNFCEKEYKNTECNLQHSSEHVELLANFVKKEIIPKISYRNFLDIGPGPGFITNLIAKHFASTTIIEPNKEYLPLYKNSNYSIHTNNFENINLKQKYDLILCSHVLYHVEKENWPMFVKKIHNLLENGGKAIIALVAPRGSFHNLCFSINKNYSNSATLFPVFELMKIFYEIEKVSCLYRTNDFEHLHKLISIFAIDDCFTPAEYKILSKNEKCLIGKKIEEFVGRCKKTSGVYEFFSEEDYLIISKPLNP